MEIIHLEGQNFKKLIQEPTILVDFYANWCGPCKMLSPILEKVSSDIKVIKVDVDKFEKLSREYGIMSIPTVILFENGEEVKRNIGFMSQEQVEKFISNK